MSCGNCTECCTAVAVKELGKTEFTKCTHADKGCSVYLNRPVSCSKFQCVYLSSKWPKKYRPDKSGVMFASFGGDVVSAYEMRPDAFHNASKLIKKVAAKHTVTLVRRADGTDRP